MADRINLCLWQGSRRLELTPKAFEVLDHLRRNPGRLVSADEILDAVWPKTFVQPEIVKTYIRTLRRLLGDDARQPRFIETRPRCGYRFVGELPERGEVTDARRLSRLVGRRAQMTMLQEIFAAAEGGNRQFVVVTGEAGLGKTALLEAFKAEIDPLKGPVVASAYGNPGFGQGEPLSVIISLLADLSRLLDPELFHSSLSTFAPSWRLPVQDCARSVPLGSPTPGVETTEAPDRLVREACALIEHLAQRTTLVLLVEDLQWADSASLAVIGSLARRRYPARILFGATYRQVEFLKRCPVRDLTDSLLLHDLAREIALTPLTEGDVRAFLRFLPNHGLERAKGANPKPPVERSPTSKDRARTLTLRSGGNPLLLKALVRGEEEPRRGDLGRNAALSGAAQRRSTVALGLDLQLQDVGPTLREALEAASLAGRRFCAWSVGRIVETEQADVETMFAKLSSSQQILVEDGWYPLPDGSLSPIYKFKHGAHRAVLLNGQSADLRMARHGKLGHCIEAFWGDHIRDVAADVCQRFEFAGDWPRAIDYAQLAASEALERSAHRRAARLLAHALRLASHLPTDRRHAAEGPIHRQLHELGGNRDSFERRATQRITGSSLGAMVRSGRSPRSLREPRCVS
jgi:predicted ATPase